MKVDMSPKAVTQRLRILDELWLLSMKLINSKTISKTRQRRSGEQNMAESKMR